jgi:hypothetical protein
MLALCPNNMWWARFLAIGNKTLHRFQAIGYPTICIILFLSPKKTPPHQEPWHNYQRMQEKPSASLTEVQGQVWFPH